MDIWVDLRLQGRVPVAQGRFSEIHSKIREKVLGIWECLPPPYLSLRVGVRLQTEKQGRPCPFPSIYVRIGGRACATGSHWS